MTNLENRSRKDEVTRNAFKKLEALHLPSLLQNVCAHMNRKDSTLRTTQMKVLPWVVVGAGGLGAGKTSGAGTRGVSLDVVIGCRTGHSDTNGGKSSDNRSKVHADCGPAENPSL